MRFSIKDLGCKVNAYEAAWYRQQLLAMGWQQVDFGQPADVCLINSCTVTNTAGAKSRQMLHAARQANPQAVVAIVGCYVQMTADQPEILQDADVVVGSRHKDMVPALLAQAVIDRRKVWLVDGLDGCPFEAMPVDRFDHARAYLKIQDGCQQFCTYCVIPYARGPQRCLGADQAIAYAKRLTAAGYREIVLTGIHTGRYRDGATDLTGLMGLLLSQAEGLQRLRLSSIEMTEITDGLLDLMADDRRIARHLHIPLQAGSDAILKAMGRPYDTSWFARRLQEIRRRLPGVSISTDVIVGFPGETDELFAQSRRFIAACGFTFLHVFPYAAKAHTPAAVMAGQLPGTVKKARVADLTALSHSLYNETASRMVGRTVRVLFETASDGRLGGHCGEYLTVTAAGPDSLVHEMADVVVTGFDGTDLLGRLDRGERA